MNKTIGIVIAIILLVGVGVAVYALVLAPANNAAPAADPMAGLTYYSPGAFFVTNIVDSERLLKAEIMLGIQGKHEEELKAKNVQIRDEIINTLRQKTEDELRASDAQDVLREEIVKNLREKLNMDYLVTLNYSEFVLQ